MLLRKLIPLLLGLCLAMSANAAITLNSSAGDDTEGSNATTHTVTVSVVAGSNRIAVMCTSGNADSPSEHSMTFASSTMTELIDTAPSPAFHLLTLAHLHESLGGGWSGTGSKAAVDTWTTSTKVASLVVVLDGADNATPVDAATLTSTSTVIGGATSIGSLSPSVATGNIALTCYSYVGAELTDAVYQSGEAAIASHYDPDGFYGVIMTSKAGAGGATAVGITSMTSHRVRMATVEFNAAAGGGSTQPPRSMHQNTMRNSQ